MKKQLIGLVSTTIVASAFMNAPSLAQESRKDSIDEIIVRSSFTDQLLSDIHDTVRVLDGEDIAAAGAKSLGASLENVLGATVSDYGAAVGQPVIRGLSGNRVKILNNGMVVRDIAGLGADHVNDVDMNNIQQIEVVRGPSSLLYANGSVGGIINIVDNTIARKDFDGAEFRVGLEAQSVNDGFTGDASYQGHIGGINLSIGLKETQFEQYEIPSNAVIHTEEHEGEEEHEEEHATDRLANSDYETKAQKIGISKTGDRGHIGLSVQKIEGLYGIPFHGEEHEEEGAEGEEEEHEGERIFSTTDSEVINFEGSYVFENGWLDSIDFHFRDSDYTLTEQHAEAHAEGEEEGEEEEEAPTLFSTDAQEYGIIFSRKSDTIDQKLVLNFATEDMSIIGEEAFMNPTESRENTLGYYLGKDFEHFFLDVGIRYDRINRKGSVTEAQVTETYDLDMNNTSYAVSFGRDLSPSTHFQLGLAQVERAPSALELFINGPHLATGRFEEGDVTLGSEKSNNIDITFDYQRNGVFATLSLFKNDIDNYIYLEDETDADHAEEDDDHDHGDLILAHYRQQDAELEGYEFEIGKNFALEGGSLSLSFGRDAVTGKFKDGTRIPRMSPARNIYTASYTADAVDGSDGMMLSLVLKDVEKQDRIAANETQTDSHQMLDFNFTKSFRPRPDRELKLSVFASNLLDEAARNHTSYIKNEVPLPGRNVGIRLQTVF